MSTGASPAGDVAAGDERLERKVARRLLPFASVAVAAHATAFIPPGPASRPLTAAAVALTVAIVAVGVASPWSRLPRWTFLLPPLAYFAVIVLLGAAQGEAASAYTPLALLPVVWVAVNLGPIAVALTAAAGSVVIAAPLLIAGATSSELRLLLILIAVSVVVGLAVNALVRDKRRQAALALAHAGRAQRNEAVLAAVAAIARDFRSTDVRERVCNAARELAGATVAFLAEREGAELAVTAASTPTLVGLTLPPDSAGVALDAPRVRLLRRAAEGGEDDWEHHRQLTDRVELAAILTVPLVVDGRVRGMLVVGWASAISRLPSEMERTMELLADEAAIAIERADLLDRLEGQARTDSLTGLPNRRAWEEKLAQAIARTSRTGERLHAAVIDLDRFKAFNDRNGHQAGDRLLVASAEAWRGAMRTDDFLARYGGEEFGLLLAGCDEPAATQIVERLLQLTPLGQTASAGVSSLKEGDDGPALVSRADRALYAAKQSGRNRMVVYRPAAHVT